MYFFVWVNSGHCFGSAVILAHLVVKIFIVVVWSKIAKIVFKPVQLPFSYLVENYPVNLAALQIERVPESLGLDSRTRFSKDRRLLIFTVCGILPGLSLIFENIALEVLHR